MMYKRCDIKDWLDQQIVFWRNQRDEAEAGDDHLTVISAISMIDAYQETRLVIFEEALPS